MEARASKPEFFALRYFVQLQFITHFLFATFGLIGAGDGCDVAIVAANGDPDVVPIGAADGAVQAIEEHHLNAADARAVLRAQGMTFAMDGRAARTSAPRRP